MQSRALRGVWKLQIQPHQTAWKKVAVLLFSVLGVCLFMYLFLWPRELVTCRRPRNNNGCLSMGLENTADKGHDRHYFPPQNRQILPNILKLNEAHCWLDHKTLQETSNQSHPSCSYLPPSQNWLYERFTSWSLKRPDVLSKFLRVGPGLLFSVVTVFLLVGLDFLNSSTQGFRAPASSGECMVWAQEERIKLSFVPQLTLHQPHPWATFRLF